MLILNAKDGWRSESIYFILAIPQADVDFLFFIKIPIGVEILGANYETHVL